MRGIAPAERGFTLIEMLVALTIFALIAAAGVGLLRSSVDLQDVVDRRLGEMSDLARVDALLASDFGQALNRASRSPSGPRPAFLGTGSAIQLVAASAADEGAGLRRVQWSGDAEGLARTNYPLVDGGDGGATKAVILPQATRATFRYRRQDGSWAPAFSSTPEEPLPAAVEIAVEGPRQPRTLLLYALPLGGIDLPKPAEGTPS